MMNHKLRELRKSKGLSIEKVAVQIGVPVSTYRDYEYGTRLPADLLKPISELYEMSISDLLGVSSSDEALNEVISNVIYSLEKNIEILKQFRRSL